MRRVWRWVALVGMATAAAAAAVGCGADDRTMRRPSSHQTTTTQPPPPAASPGQPGETVALMRLTSPVFTADQPLPDRYTCKAEGLSPQLQWSNVPGGTAQLALVVRDLDANGFVHWVVAGVEPTLGELIEGELPDSATTSLNSFGQPGWGPPCPPAGSTHRYEILLYALSQDVVLSPDTPADQAVRQVESTPAMGTASLIGTVTV